MIRLVRRFYLHLAGANVTAMPDTVRRNLVIASRKVNSEQVRVLLAGGWREVAVGAWLALAFPADDVRDAVLAALARARGDDTALPLAAVSTVLAGPAAVTTLDGYPERVAGQPDQDGSFEILTAAVANLGGGVPTAPGWAIGAFDELLGTARDLEQSFRAARQA